MAPIIEEYRRRFRVEKRSVIILVFEILGQRVHQLRYATKRVAGTFCAPRRLCR